MKNIHQIIIASFIIILAIPSFVAAQDLTAYYGNAYEQFDEFARDFSVTYDFLSPTEIEVTEEISYDFKDLERHGIFRTIPTERNGVSFKVNPNSISVLDSMDQERKFEVTENFTSVVLKIGDPNIFESGEVFYKIKYKIERLSTSGESFDINITDLGWTVPVVNIRFSLIGGNVDISCIASNDEEVPNCSIEKDGGVVVASNNEPLYPGTQFVVTLKINNTSSPSLVLTSILLLIALVLLYIVLRRRKKTEGVVQENA